MDGNNGGNNNYYHHHQQQQQIHHNNRQQAMMMEEQHHQQSSSSDMFSTGGDGVSNGNSNGGGGMMNNGNNNNNNTDGHSIVSHGGESYVSGGNNTFTTGSGSVPDVMLLNMYCARAKAPKTPITEQSMLDAEHSWQPVREWLGHHSAEQVRQAAEQRGESGLTALHFACRHVPPRDVIDVFLSIAADTVQWPDSFGWLPIHYACASGSDTEVIKALAEAYPESKTTIDRRGRTPLHFALGDKPASPNVIFLLSSSGAASYPDEIGMLPLHYACAFGASEEVLYVLTDAYPEAIKTKDKRDRTPLHFALSNAGRKTVPSAVRLLLSLNREIVNSIDGGPLPLRVLAEYATVIKSEDEKKNEKRESVHRCLEHLLSAEPDPTADFLTALQSLPDWLSERAVVMPQVQLLLNDKISQRFPTAVLILDFYMIVMIIAAYGFSVDESIKNRFSTNGDELTADEVAVKSRFFIPLYVGAAYFILREVVQVISLISLKSFNIWLYDPSNHLNLIFVFLVTFWTIRMHTGTGDRDNFRVGAAISVTVLWVKLLAYLRNMMIDFAVFVGGVFYVVRRLAAFLTALGVILIAFAQMFYTIFQQTDYCSEIEDDNNNNNNSSSSSMEEITGITDEMCGTYDVRHYCDFWDAFLSVYTMLLGEVDETKFVDNAVAIALFIMFMFLVVILLANVLIAIVTDSYKVIQDQRAAIVFWTNRLDYVAEMDAIANGPWRRRLRQMLGYDNAPTSSSSSSGPGGQPGGPDNGGTSTGLMSASALNRRSYNGGFNRRSSRHHTSMRVDPMNNASSRDATGAAGDGGSNDDSGVFGKELWKQIMDLYEDDSDEGFFSFDFWAYVIMRIIAAILIPLWLIIGILTFGWFWPPQVREVVFTSIVFKHSSEGEKEDELRKTQVKKLQDEVKDLKYELLQELALDRTQVVQMKSQVAERKMDIVNEMKDIKRIVAVLFERQASQYPE